MTATSTLYLAAPLFNPQELAFNLRLSEILERRFNVFLPQRDGLLLPGTNLADCDISAKKRRIFEFDCEAIDKSDVVFCVLDGRVIDEGVAFELGYAYAKQKTCIGFKSDHRVLLPFGDNPMIDQALSTRLTSVEAVEQWVSRSS